MNKTSFSVLFVCTGNICRSPTAEAVFRRRIGELGHKRVTHDSAGTHGYHIGEPPDHRSISTALAKGTDMAGLYARKLERADFEAFDHILAMDRMHLDRMQQMAGQTFKASLGLLLDYFEGYEGQDVPDPYYGTQLDFDEAYRLIEGGVDGFLKKVVFPTG